jgi:hemin uptake protein HemP
MDTSLLPDPANNRVVKTLKPPPHRPIPSNQLFKGPQEVDWVYLM